ncbi:diguanylate cyclase [Glaciihabitans sp. dw_435]|uniref:GGDEF domain-containing protein n=1 Tax=Glaciihabitans sp. dw_435 TaxID=2720081 RepID=UPI001BD4DAC2|nr:sensor domain-containing diguanylate cyclase [Glaciihabitans sp. dw_435]
MIEVSGAGIILDANEVFYRWFSPTQPTIIGSSLEEVLGTAGAELAASLVLSSDGTTELIPTVILQPTAINARSFIAASNKLDNGNAVVAIVDASRHQGSGGDFERAHLASLRESERLQLLLAASVNFGNASNARELGELLADTARRSFRADFASVHVIDGGSFVLYGGSNPLAAHWPAQAPVAGARTMQLGKILTITDPRDAEVYLPHVGIAAVMESSDVHSIIVAPITDHDTPIGTVACYFSHRRTFDEQAEPLIRALTQQSAQVFRRLRLEETILRSAMLDDITGLPNRRLFEQQLVELSRTTAVMFLDLDGFKTVNDSLGHATGDHVLALVAERLRGIFRRTDSVARYGGDEFVAIIDATNPEEAMAVAERARAAIAEPFSELPTNYRVTASIGVALDFRKLPSSIESLVRLADKAMYDAKAQGGNKTEYKQLS